ncbi:MAG: hypothetical protein M0R17_05670 [Candidatus Omnitrophica bacterium]|jgi:hypothetical protein|nr:hypothetical protein [Candidatus Omnitrophota bacterium]
MTNIFYDECGVRTWVVITLFILGMITLTLLLVILMLVIDKASCGEYSKMLGLETKWNALTECMVKTSEGFIPIDNYLGVKNLK